MSICVGWKFPFEVKKNRVSPLLGCSRCNFGPLLSANSSSSAAEVRPDRSNFRVHLRHVRTLLGNRSSMDLWKGSVGKGRHATGGGAVFSVCWSVYSRVPRKNWSASSAGTANVSPLSFTSGSLTIFFCPFVEASPMLSVWCVVLIKATSGK